MYSSSPSSDVYIHLKRIITTGEIPLGKRIPVRSIRKRLTASSGDTKSALKSLRSEGLTCSIPLMGHYVFNMDKHLIVNMLNFNFTLERNALKLSMREHHDCLTKRLEWSLKKMEDFLFQNRLNEYYRYQSIYHDSFFIWCKNPVYETLHNRFSLRIMTLRSQKELSSEYLAFSLLQYRKITEYIRGGDLIQACEELKKPVLIHYLSNIKSLKK